MISSPAGQSRNVIPRWRSLKRTIAAMELANPPQTGLYTSVQPLSDEFRLRLETWRRGPNVVSAAELVEIALIEGEESKAVSAARALIGGHLSPTRLIKDQARRLLERRGEIVPAETAEEANLEKHLHLWRHRTRGYPLDSLAWVELARLQIARGAQRDARRSMSVARQLAPEDRHVIRSAARMYLHLREADAAHDLLRRSDVTRHDPWLTAAEIGIAAHRKKSPQLFKVGIALIEAEKFRPHQVTELAAAIGTTLLRDGYRKRGKRMIERGLADPTGNTLAQAEWITQALHEPVLESTSLVSRGGANADANEAQALQLFRLGDFTKSLVFADRWIAEEPFSTRAYVAGVAAASAAQDYTQTILLAERGLRYDPTSKPILNNKVFALACTNRMNEAERLLESIPVDDSQQTFVSEANRGLIAFRRGLNDFAIAQYRLAIAGFRRNNDIVHEQIAFAYLARESVLANDPQAKAFIDEAENKIGTSDAPQAKKILGDAKLAFQASNIGLRTLSS